MTPVISQVSAKDYPNPNYEDVGFAAALEQAKELGCDLPLLNRAVRNMNAAVATEISWKLPGKAVAKNLTQIVRHPFAHTHSQLATAMYGAKHMRDSQLLNHLQAVEQIIEHGKPARRVEFYWEQDEDGEWYVDERRFQSCGGFRHFLRRDLTGGDVLALRPLRDLTFLKNRQAPDEDMERQEWLSEFSLQIIPAR